MSEALVNEPFVLTNKTLAADGANLLKIKLILLRDKKWRYLRYMHFKNYLEKVADEVQSVCICGAGGGFAEVALAIEFPQIKFTLTDIIANGYPSYHRAMDIAWRFGIDNIGFSVWNVLAPTKRRFDLVASTEMLEHIKNDQAAANNMRNAAKKYLYCLVPFAEDSRNANPAARKRAWDHCEHYVCGYDARRLQELFGKPLAIAGTYWNKHGGALRAKLEALSTEEIDQQSPLLFSEAALDDTGVLQSTVREAAGIKILTYA